MDYWRRASEQPGLKRATLMVFKILLRYLLVAVIIGALLYFGAKLGQPGGLRMETSGL